jgi:hypothetical protein
MLYSIHKLSHETIILPGFHFSPDPLLVSDVSETTTKLDSVQTTHKVAKANELMN